MQQYSILEVTSGFGMGGAEKALVARLRYLPAIFGCVVLNVRPEIDVPSLSQEATQVRITARYIFRVIEIIKFLSNRKFDVIVVRTPLDAIRFALAKNLLLLKDTKLVFEAHTNYISKRVGVNLLFKVLLFVLQSSIDQVIAVSENSKVGPLCKSQKNVERIYLGSDLDMLNVKLVQNSNPKLLYVGRLTEVKRPIWLLERLLKLSKELALPKPSLIMIGAGVQENVVKEFIQRHNLFDLVKFEGTHNDLTQYYASSTHLVSCSINEGLPLTFFEAKLAGLQILATPSGGGHEILGPEDFLLNSFSEEEFESCLKTIFSSSPLSLEQRYAIQSKSEWMRAQNGAKHYYSLILELCQPE